MVRPWMKACEFGVSFAIQYTQKWKSGVPFQFLNIFDSGEQFETDQLKMFMIRLEQYDNSMTHVPAFPLPMRPGRKTPI